MTDGPRQVFTVRHLNIQSIQNKLSILNAELLSEEQPDLLILSETWLCEENVHLFIPCGYKIASSFTRTNKRGGGVTIYAKMDLETETIKIKCATEELFECCATRIKSSHQKIIALGVYRSPTADHELSLKLMEEAK